MVQDLYTYSAQYSGSCRVKFILVALFFCEHLGIRVVVLYNLIGI